MLKSASLLKRCSKCKKLHRLSSFYLASNRLDKCRSQCKACDKKQNLAYQLHHKNQHNQRNTEWRFTLKGRYAGYKKSAAQRKIPFRLTLKAFNNITQCKCYYCDRFTHGHTFCGIDRLNSRRGYMLSNVVPCCTRCNIMKHTLTAADFLDHIYHISITHPKDD